MADKKTQFLDPIVILKDNTSRLRLKAYLDEYCELKDKVASMQETLKECVTTISEDLKLNPKVVRQLMKISYNNEFEQKKLELDEMSEIIRLMTMEENDRNNS